jgi:PAS domain S-box-containing protein
LSRDEQLYHQVFDCSHEALLVLEMPEDGSERVVDLNPRCERMFGVSREHCVGRPLDQILHRRVAAEIAAECRRCMACHHESCSIEIQTSIGDQVLQLTLTPLADDTCGGRRISVALQHTTDAAIPRSDAYLQDSEFRAMVENTPDYVARYALDGSIQYVNPALERFMHRSLSEVRGRTSREIYGDSTGQMCHTAILKSVSTRSVTNVESCFQSPSGQIVCHYVTFSPEFNANTEVVSVLGTGRDITRLKQSEALLGEREREFRTIVENSPDLIARYDRDARVQYVNQAVVRTTGIPAEEMLGRTISVAPIEYCRAVERALMEGVDCRMEVELPLERGALFIDALIVPERDASGAVTSVLSLSRDLTEMKAAEEELRRLNSKLEERVAMRTAALESANRELESFAHTVSHDLRAPLRAITTFAALLIEQEREHLLPKGRQMIERIAGAACKLNELIDGILEHSRAGQRRLQRRRVVFEQLVREIVAEVQEQYPEGQVVIHELPPVEGDPTMLRQIVQNLIHNAFKFSGARVPRCVEIGCRVGQGQHVFYVRDNGAGFDMKYAQNLFGMFQRMHSGLTVPGTGVGLAIVKRLIERHGGRIWAESSPDAGATFFFTLEGAETLSQPSC